MHSKGELNVVAEKEKGIEVDIRSIDVKINPSADILLLGTLLREFQEKGRRRTLAN